MLPLGCDPGGSEIGGLSPGLPPEASEEEGSSGAEGCVANATSGSTHTSLQAAFEAASEGDRLELCEGSLAAGGSTSLSLELVGGRILGEVSLGGGNVTGLAAQGLSVGPREAVLAEVEVDSFLATGPVELSASEVGVARLKAAATLTEVRADSLQSTASVSAVGLVVSGSWEVHGGSSVASEVEADGLVVESGELELRTSRLTGPVSVGLEGSLALVEVSLDDPGATGISVAGGHLEAEGLEILDSTVDTDRVGLRCEGGSLDLDGVVVQGFAGAVLEAEGCVGSVAGLEGTGGVSLTGGELEGSGWELDLVEAAADEDGLLALSLVDSRVDQLTLQGGALSLEGVSLGGVAGTALSLRDCTAELTSVTVEEVDAVELTNPLPDGGWTVSEDGGVGIEATDCRLVLGEVSLLDLPYGIRATRGSVTGSGLMAWRTWQAAIQMSGGSVSLTDLWVGEGRGWGIVLNSGQLELDSPTFTELSTLRRTTWAYTAEGDPDGVATTLSQVPAIAATESEVSLLDPVFLDLSGQALTWDAEAAELEIKGLYLDLADLAGVELSLDGDEASATIRDSTITDTRGHSLTVSGEGGGTLEVSGLAVSESEQIGLQVEGVGEVRVEDLVVFGVSDDGARVAEVGSLSLSDFAISETGGAGLWLEGVEGTVAEGSLGRATSYGLAAVGSVVGLSDLHVYEAPTGLRCDASTTVEPCSDLSFTLVDVPVDGCPEVCEP